MNIRIFSDYRDATAYVYKYMHQGRLVGLRKLRSGKWEAKVLARKPKNS